MAGPYDIYPAVDAGYNFPPEIRTALVSSTDVQTALNGARDAGATKAAAALTGIVNAFAGSAAPSGWLFCDGTAISRTTYAALYAIIGTTYGAGDGSSTFNLPNLKGRIPVGIDSSQTEFTTVGQIGGEKAHQLVVAEIPSHTHVQNSHNHTITDPGHNHSQNAHSHGISDPGHSHTVNDPGHGHYVNDPGHGHGSSTLSGFQTYQTTTASRGQFTTSSGGRYSISSTDQNAIGYGVAANSGTGISLNGSTTGITLSDRATGVAVQNTTATNNSSTTGLTLSNSTAVNQSTGGDGSHNNLQPYMAMNYIIHV